MKSGPTLNGATRLPACRSAPIKPVATVVFPLPDAGAAMTTPGTLTPTPASGRVCTPTRRKSCQFAVARADGVSPLDALLALAACVHRMLDLGHLRHQIGRVKQLLGGITAGDHHMLGAGPRRQGRDHLIDVDPAPLQRIGELVEHIEVVPFFGQPARNLGPAVGGGRRMVDLTTVLARPRPARPHLVPLDGPADTVLVVHPAQFT